MGFEHQLANESLGKYGSIVIADTTQKDGTFGAIVSLDALTQFTTLTGNCAGYGANTIPAGIAVYGTFSAIKLAAGKVIAYYDRQQG